MRCEMWDVRCEMWNVRCKMWDVRCEMCVSIKFHTLCLIANAAKACAGLEWTRPEDTKFSRFQR